MNKEATILDKADSQSNEFTKFYITLLGFAAIYFFRLLANNICFFDDFQWVDGIKEINCTLGRPFADLLHALSNFKLLNLDDKGVTVIDNGNFNQFVFIVFSCFGVTVFCQRYLKLKYNLYSSLVYFSFLMCPSVLGSIIYKIDCLYFGIGLTLALLASVNFNFKNSYYNILTGSLFLTLCISSYQAYINVFFGLMVFKFLLLILKDKSPYKEFLLDSTKVISSCLVYKLVIVKLCSVYMGYLDKRISENFADGNIFAGIIHNFKSVSPAFFGSYRSASIIIFFAALSLICLLIIIFTGKTKRATMKLEAIVAIPLLIIAPMGVLLIAKYPNGSPRTTIGLAVLILCSYFILYIFADKYNQKLKILLLVPTLFFFFISNSYAAMEKNQKDHSTRMAYDIISTMNDNGINRESKTFFHGNTGVSKCVLHSIRSHSLLDYLLQWGVAGFYNKYFFRHLGLTGIIGANVTAKNINILHEGESIRENKSFKIYKHKNNFAIIFRNSPLYEDIYSDQVEP